MSIDTPVRPEQTETTETERRPIWRRGRFWTILLVVGALIAALAIVLPSGTGPPAGEPDGGEAGQVPAEGAARVDRVRLAAENGFGYLSPFSHRGGRGQARTLLLFDTLGWKDAAGEHQPLLAESWEVSEDTTEWTITLRENATWHDGTPVTADDVVFTFDYMQNGPGEASRYVPRYEVTSVADGPHTVVLSTDQPVATFVNDVIGTVMIVPRHVWEDVDDPAAYRAPDGRMGSGPYTLESADPETGAYLFAANDDYFLGPPQVRRVEYVPASNQLLALRQGELEVAQFGIGDKPIPDEAFEPLQSPRYETITEPGYWNRTIFFNLTRGFPYDDARFRQAVAYSIDREDMVERILFGRGAVGSMGGLPSSPWVPPDLPDYDHDSARAAELLDEAGLVDADGDGIRDLPDGSPFRPEMITNSRFNPDTAELVSEHLRAVGIDLNILSLESVAADSAGAEGSYQMALVGHGYGDADPDNLQWRYSPESPMKKNFMRVYGYDNERFIELADEQFTAVDEEERIEIAHEAQRIFAEDAVTVSLYVPDRILVFDREVYDGWYLEEALQVPYKQIFVGTVGE